jgi:hypothetical protein
VADRTAVVDRCRYCGIGAYPGGLLRHEAGCPANPDEEAPESPELLAAIHAAVVAEACRWRGIPEPRACGEFTRISDVWRYARVALKVVREFDEARKAGG